MSTGMRTKKALAGMTDFVAFEELCCALLCSYGQYQGIIPQGAGRVDGGKDALLIHWDFKGDGWASTMIDKKVFHFSLRKDVKDKLKEDLKKVKKNYPNPTHVVFVTSQPITPTKRDNLIKEAEKKYGWNLEILEQSFFCPPLDTQYIRLRKEYLGIDYDETIFTDLNDLLQLPERNPNISDFEQGVYYRNPFLHDAVSTCLKKDRFCLITGKPGSGKTALAWGIGYEFRRQHTNNIVFYRRLSSEGEKAPDWIKHIKQFDFQCVLFIIDDCHTAVDAVNELKDKRMSFKEAKVLLVSRPVPLDLAGTTEESFLESFKSQTVPLNVDQRMVREIIERLTWRDDIEPDEIGDIVLVLKKCEGDLHILNFYVSAWLKNRAKYTLLSDVDESMVLENVYTHYLKKNKPYMDELLAIAALSQFEIPVEARWLGNNHVIDGVRRDAWVEESIVDAPNSPIVLLGFFHSTPARYLLEAALKKGRLGKSLDDYVIEQLERYLAIKPHNYKDVTEQLSKNSRSDLNMALFSQEVIFKEFKSRVKDAGMSAVKRFTIQSNFMAGNIKSRILVVDDETMWREQIKEILKRDVYDIVTAESGEKAIKLINAQEFNLVITDMRMESEFSGIEVLEYVKKVSPLTPVIILTTFGTIQTAKELMMKGAFDLFEKGEAGSSIEELRRRVAEALEKRELDQKLQLDDIVMQQFPSFISEMYFELIGLLDPMRKIKLHIDLFESMIKFFIIVMLCEYLESEVKLPGLNVLFVKNRKIFQIPTMENMINIAEKLYKRKERFPDHYFLNLYSNFFSEENFNLMKGFLEIRNKWIHHSQLSEAEYNRMIDFCESALTKLLQDQGFLTNLSLCKIETIRKINQEMIHTFVCRGIFPKYSRKEQVFSKPLPCEEVLLLHPEDERYISLEPFVILMHCPECDQLELFIYVRIENNKIHYSSYRTGHEFISEAGYRRFSELINRIRST